MLTPLKALRSTTLTSTQRLTQIVAQMQIRCVPMALHQPDQLCCITDNDLRQALIAVSAHVCVWLGIVGFSGCEVSFDV